MGITQFDLVHTPDNFLNKLARLEDRLAVLDRRFASLDQDSYMKVPTGVECGIGLLSFGEPSLVVIDSDTITAVKSYLLVDTEGAAANDDLFTIQGGRNGALLCLRAYDSTNTVVVKDGATTINNLRLAGDFSLTHTDDTILLVCADIGGDLFWLELSRSNNTV